MVKTTGSEYPPPRRPCKQCGKRCEVLMEEVCVDCEQLNQVIAKSATIRLVVREFVDRELKSIVRGVFTVVAVAGFAAAIFIGGMMFENANAHQRQLDRKIEAERIQRMAEETKEAE